MFADDVIRLAGAPAQPLRCRAMATTLRTVPPSPPPPTVLPCSDPATGERFGEATVMDRDAVVAVVQRARAAQAAWARTSWAERRAVLSDILRYVVQHQEEICRLAVRDSGKTMVDAAMGEIFPVCEKLRYTIAHGEADLRAERRPSGLLPHKARARRVPAARGHRRDRAVELPVPQLLLPDDPGALRRQRGGGQGQRAGDLVVAALRRDLRRGAAAPRPQP